MVVHLSQSTVSPSVKLCPRRAYPLAEYVPHTVSLRSEKSLNETYSFSLFGRGSYISGSAARDELGSRNSRHRLVWRGSFGLHQSARMSDIHAFVRAFISEDTAACACLHVPDPDGAIIATACDGTPIGMKGDRPDTVGVTGQAFDALAAADIPQAHRSIVAP